MSREGRWGIPRNLPEKTRVSKFQPAPEPQSLDMPIRNSHHSNVLAMVKIVIPMFSFCFHISSLVKLRERCKSDTSICRDLVFTHMRNPLQKSGDFRAGLNFSLSATRHFRR